MEIFFSKNLKYCFRRFGVSQTELASYLNKGQTTLSNWVTGLAEPNLETFYIITVYFGIEASVFLNTDLEHGKLITDQMVAEFKANGKPIGKGIGKLIGQKQSVYELGNAALSTVNEPDRSMMWVVMKKLEDIQLSIDKLHQTKGK